MENEKKHIEHWGSFENGIWIKHISSKYEFEQQLRKFKELFFGYRQAAKILLEQNHDAYKDYLSLSPLIYPALYLYRHMHEIGLKSVISFFYHHNSVEEKCPKNHDLTQLWEIAKPYIKTYLNTNHQELDLKGYEKILNTLIKVDPYSTSFKYPTDKKGNPSIKSKPKSIESYNKDLEKTYDFFDNLFIGFICYYKY